MSSNDQEKNNAEHNGPKNYVLEINDIVQDEILENPTDSPPNEVNNGQES